MQLRSEKQIVSNWKNYKSNDMPMVTISCATYNHVKYISKTIECFLNQVTTFPIEIIIHDDCSTDGTADIIRKYAEAYPNIIIPLYESENQYSKHNDYVAELLRKKTRGKYTAICEGDDFWTDNNKLQKQINFLENNMEYSLCAHKALVHELYKDRLDHRMPRISKDTDYSTDKIIENGPLFATCSIVYRSNIMPLPAAFSANGFSDYQLAIYASFKGKVRCFKDEMSQYNHGVDGSWTKKTINNNNALVEHNLELIRMLNNVNKAYEYKYEKSISKKLNHLSSL